MKATFRALLLAAVGAVALSASAVAQEGFVAPETDRVFSQGVAAYKRGDFATALRIWRPLAEQGDADAQSNLGLMYDNGEGVPENDAEAVRWYRLAAERGLARAQAMLGARYYFGEGVPENYAEALRWFLLAAEQGLDPAQFHLGNMYYRGEGVPENYAEAYKWWALAAARGDANAKQKRDILRNQMTPAQIAEAQELAAEWKPKE